MHNLNPPNQSVIDSRKPSEPGYAPGPEAYLNAGSLDDCIEFAIRYSMQSAEYYTDFEDFVDHVMRIYRKTVVFHDYVDHLPTDIDEDVETRVRRRARLQWRYVTGQSETPYHEADE